MSARPLHPADIPVLSREIKQRFVKTRFGWHVHTTQGPMIVGDAGISAWTRKGAERKAARLVRHLKAQDAAETFQRVIP